MSDEPDTLTIDGAGPKGTSRIAGIAELDHFIVLEVLGEGGMGVVYAAYDKRLDRKVAVKVVRENRADPEQARHRLLREAQAMARIAHPNVVTVLEVGTIDRDVYIALEYVEGSTLRAWLKQPRTWREIVEMFAQAGQGLIAVHEVGLVHRDFKPDNVLVRRDGRAQITDFGVVRFTRADDSNEAAAASEPPVATSHPHLTSVDMRLGTPSYTAPEQYAGGDVDARADQFSFCVALWEALYGQRPFTGKSQETLARAIASGAIRQPRQKSGVPSWIEAVLRRGLRVAPEERWPNMAALLAALNRDPIARRRRILVASTTAVAIGAIVGIAWVGWTRDPDEQRCQGAARHLAGIWDASQARALRRAFLSSNAPFAMGTADRVTASLDRWAHAWIDMRVATCEATATGEQSEGMLDLRIACLDRRRDELGALVTVLGTGDRTILAEAVSAVSRLPALDACADRETLAATIPLPQDATIRARIATIRREIAVATANERAGAYGVGREVANHATERLTGVAYAPVEAEALVARAKLEARDGDPAAARATLAGALRAAAVARDDRLTAHALVDLVAVLRAQARIDEAELIAIVADAAVERVGDQPAAGDLLIQRAALAVARGDYAAAEAIANHAIELREHAFGATHASVAEALNVLGGIRDRRGDVVLARAAYERAVRIGGVSLGEDHPSVAVTRANLCHLDFLAGAVTEARACQEHVVKSLEESLGDAHPAVAWALNDVALIQSAQRDRAGARARFERAQHIWERTSGPEHPDVAWPLINLGMLALEDGDRATAEPLCRKASRILEVVRGPDHPELALPLACLGRALVETSPREAIAVLHHALRLFPTTGSDTTGSKADVSAARGALARAHAILERSSSRP